MFTGPENGGVDVTDVDNSCVGDGAGLTSLIRTAAATRIVRHLWGATVRATDVHLGRVLHVRCATHARFTASFSSVRDCHAILRTASRRG